MQRGGIIINHDSDTNTRFVLTKDAGATELFRVQEDGNFGIGTKVDGEDIMDIPKRLAEEARKSAECKYCGMKLEKCGCGYC